MTKAQDIAGLSCEASAARAITIALETRFQEMRALRDAALEWSEPEGVHDMRVALRRLRSALRDFAPFMRKRPLASPLRDLKKLADALGRVRDEDVAVLALEELAANAPPEVKKGIERFIKERVKRRDAARDSLVKEVEDEALAKLQQRFTRALERAAHTAKAPPRNEKKKAKNDEGAPIRAQMNFREAGRRITKARLEELQKLSASLYRPLKAKPLHDMRIAAKRLRYAIELFTPCWKNRTTPFAKEVAALQTSLGELHDCDVWIEDFGAQLVPLKHEEGRVENLPGLNAEERSAAVWLLSHFAKTRTKHFRDALARWHAWEQSDFAARLCAELETEHCVNNIDRLLI